MPWLNRLSPRVNRSTLPVRSPWPSKQPSTRSAPASNASSAAATPVPRSLCGCTLIAMFSRRLRLRDMYSIWSAYTFGVARSTVAGRFTMISRSSSGCQISMTDSQISRAKSSSVSTKISGEYSKPKIVSSPRRFSACATTSRAPKTAKSIVCALSLPKTSSRNSGDVALYRWTVARGKPTRASRVRSMISGRDWVRTEIVTSSGTASASIRDRTKSKSVCDAAGKPISISLYPRLTNRSNILRLRLGSIGSISAWLPSRRSVDIQRGA